MGKIFGPEQSIDLRTNPANKIIEKEFSIQKNSVLDIHVLPGFNPHYFLQMLGLHENQEEDIDRQIFGVVNSVIKVI